MLVLQIYLQKKKNKSGGWCAGVGPFIPASVAQKKSGKLRVISQIHCFVFSNAARSLH